MQNSRKGRKSVGTLAPSVPAGPGPPLVPGGPGGPCAPRSPGIPFSPCDKICVILCFQAHTLLIHLCHHKKVALLFTLAPGNPGPPISPFGPWL